MKTKTEHVEPIVIEFSRDKIIQDFLDAQTKHTKDTYGTYMKRVIEFTNQSGKQILADSEEWIKKIFTFQKYLSQKGYSSNYIQSCLGMLRGFFNYYRKPLTLTRHETRKINSRARTTTDYQFSKEEIARMGSVADLKSRYVLYMGKCLGLRAEDFVKITYGMLRRLDLDQEAPIFLTELNTEKENVKAYPFLDLDAISVVRTILENNKDKADSEQAFTSRKQELSLILRSLAKRSNIDGHGSRIRFHCMRKFLITRLSAVASESQWKQIVGKKISEGAYVSQDQLREVYSRVMPSISISSSNGHSKKLEELEDLIQAQTKIIERQRQEIQTLTEATKTNRDATLALIKTEQGKMIEETARVKASLKSESGVPARLDHYTRTTEIDFEKIRKRLEAMLP